MELGNMMKTRGWFWKVGLKTYHPRVGSLVIWRLNILSH